MIHKKKKAIINHEEIILEVGQTSEFTVIQEILNSKNPYDKLWEMAYNFSILHEKWMNGSLIGINSELVEKDV